jgi:hypothetical protein
LLFVVTSRLNDGRQLIHWHGHYQSSSPTIAGTGHWIGWQRQRGNIQ